MCDENRCFLHQFGALFLAKSFHALSKLLILCVIAGLTRKLILRLIHEMFFPDCSMKVQDRMRCRVKPGRTRVLQEMPFLLSESAPQIGTFSLSSFTPFFNAVLTIGSSEVITNRKRVILSITIFNLLTNLII